MTDEAEKQVATPNDVGNASEVLVDGKPLIGPNQAIESSRRLDTHLNNSVADLRRGSLPSKINSLADEMAEFERDSHRVVDGIREKIAEARDKRDEAKEAQHAYYDGMINNFQETIDAVNRLSNLPLGGGGKS